MRTETQEQKMISMPRDLLAEIAEVLCIADRRIKLVDDFDPFGHEIKYKLQKCVQGILDLPLDVKPEIEVIQGNFDFKPKSVKELTDAEYREIGEANHTWLNAFSCIRPTDEFLISVGRAVLQDLECTRVRDHMGISPMIIMTANKS